MRMNNFVELKSRLFNEPLLLEPSYAQVLLGAVADRLNITSLVNGDDKLSLEDLKEGAFSFDTDRSERKPYQVVNGSAIIPVSGSLVAKTNTLRPYSGMTGYDGIKANIDMALDDDEVTKVIFDMDSSGGQVTGCFDLADYIFSKRGDKKMTALVSNLACSACYALASACDEILLSETAVVGSIGVITAHTNLEKAMDARGVEVTLIYAGDHKADGNPYKGLSAEVKDRIQTRLDRIYMMFTMRVAKYRGISVDAVVNTQALTYLGSEAVDVGLADAVVSTIDFIKELSQTSGTTITMENNMPELNTDHEQALADANATGVKTGTAEGIKQGATEMQTRIKGILACDNSEGRKTLAEHLAFNTSMSVEDADTMLGVSAKEVPVPVEATTPADSGLNAAMSEHAAAAIEADGENEAITAESDPVAFALASDKQING